MSVNREFRIAVLDDNSFYCRFLTAQLRSFTESLSMRQAWRPVIVSYTSPVDFLVNIPRRTDVAVIDYFLGNEYNGIRVLDEMLEKCPACKVIMISQQTTINTSLLSILHGAHRFIPKDHHAMINICDAVEEIIRARA